MIEIALLLFGIRALSQGKFHLTTRRVVYGSLGQLLALLACAPLPLTFLIGFAYGYRYGYAQLTQNDSLRSTLMGIEAGIVLAVLVLVYLIGWPFSQLIGPAPAKAPINPIAKIVLIVVSIGAFGLLAVTVTRVYFPELRSTLAMWSTATSMESAEEDIDAIPPEPPSAGPVPAILLAETTRPVLERMQKFNRRTLLEYYDYVGKRSPEWDEHVHKAMELAVRDFCDVTYAKTDHEPIHAATTKAIEAGCDDPLLLYVHYRYASSKMGDNEREAGFINAAQGLRASTYPYFRRTAAIQRAEELKLKRVADPRVSDAVKKLVNDRMDLIVLSAGGDERCEELEGIWFDNARQAYDAYVQLGCGLQQSWELVDASLSRDTNLQAARYFFQGWFYLQWYQRELDTTRPEEQLKRSMEARLIHGRAYLEKSWQNVPHFASANELLRWEVLKPRARDEMEKWFAGYMEHRPALPACQMKLDWLNGHKKTEEVLAFGRACRDSKNWESGIPLAVVHAHQLIADNERSESARSNYFRNRDVAADILYVYAKTLEVHPDNIEIRSRFAYYCYRCGHYRRAHGQFQILGDKLWFDSQFEARVKDARTQVEKLVSK